MTCAPHAPAGARVLLVGASATAAEEARGQAGVGPVGAVLRKCYLPASGLTIDDVAIAHLVPMHLVDRQGNGREPTPREIAQHRAAVDELVKGRVVVALGKCAAQAMAVGRWLPHPQLVVTGQIAKAEVERRCASLQKYLTRALACGTTVSDRTASQPSVDVKIVKSVDEQRLVFGVVLEPHTVDLQNDVIAPEAIEKTAHAYLTTSRVVGLGHTKQASAHVVESWIAREGLGASDVIKAGSWVLGVKVDDDETWAAVKSGQLTGFSIGGFGTRTPA